MAQEIHPCYKLYCTILCGSAIGALLKRGGIGMPIVAALIIFLIYYIISMTGEEMVKSGTLPPGFGMWLAQFA